MKQALLSSTSLATATAAPTLSVAPTESSTVASITMRPVSMLAAASMVGMLAAASPAESAVIYSVNGNTIASGGTLYLGVGTGGLSTSPSPTVGYLLISPTTTTATYSSTMTIARADATKNVLISLSPVSVTAGWGATTNPGTINNTFQSLVSTFTYSPSATLTRGNSVTNTFQIFGTLSGGGSNAPTDTTNITLISNWVAPVQSTSATATQLYVLPGQSTSGTVTVKNIGDGNLAAPTGTNLSVSSPYNLQGSVTSSAGTGFSVSPSAATLNLTDTQGTAPAASSSATFTTTYTGTTRGDSSTATVTANFTNGSTANNNAGGQSASYTFTGQTVAPQASLSSNTTQVRVGTSGSVALTVANTGDGNLAGQTPGSNLTGSVASSAGTFTGTGGALNGSTGLNDSTFGSGGVTSQTYSFTYAPTARGDSSTTVAVSLDNGTNTANAGGTLNATLTSSAVGPVYESKFTTNGGTITTSGTGANQNEVFGGTILFGEFVGGLTKQNLLISNITTDLGMSDMTTLSLTSISITGNNEYTFSLSGFNSKTANSATVKSSDNERLTGNVEIQFNQLANNFVGGQLRIQTDEGVEFGTSAGTVYVYNLQWTVPEPGTIMVFGTALLGFAISRRRRHGHGNEAVSLTARDEDQPTKA